MLNKVIGGVISIVVLAFVLQHSQNLNNWFGDDWLSTLTRDGIKAIRGG